MAKCRLIRLTLIECHSRLHGFSPMSRMTASEHKHDGVSPPPWRKALGELKVVAAIAKAAMSRRAIRRRSSGEPVLVVPGLGTSDGATALLRSHLKEAGFDVHTWNQGINRGPRPGVMRGLSIHIRAIARSSGRPVKLVGWSLGGLMARVVASRLPRDVKSVVAMGSPLTADPASSHLSAIYPLINGVALEDRSTKAMLREGAKMPVTSVYSRNDGVVAWQASADAAGQCRRVEVESTHMGLMVDADVHEQVAAELVR
jgi:alpha-beta hydrolase superfamily lysophospholipase